MPRTRDALDDCTQLNVWVQVWYGNPSGATWKNFMQQSSFVSPHSQPFRGIPPTFGLVLSRRCRSTTTTFLISVQSLFSLAPYDSLKTENRCHSNTKARHYLQVWVCWHGLEFKRPQCNGKELITFFFSMWRLNRAPHMYVSFSHFIQGWDRHMCIQQMVTVQLF